tara:strand:+ start:2087 stop:3124 length:1038 start_codon:yes stop_codon:yes gene_type:complete
MAKTTKKPAAKTAAQKKQFKLNINYKIALPVTLAAVATVSVIALLSNQQTHTETQINTPVIARTELSKKPNIDIKLFENGEQTETKIEEPVKEGEEKAEETTTAIEPVVKNLTDLEVEQTKLAEKVAELEKATSKEQIATINAKLAKLESLNGNIGNLSKIFLGQQLVLLDNAFKVGGNQNLAITNIHNFAQNVAKNEAVAKKLEELLTLTNEQAIITPAALHFYASELKTTKLITTHIQKEEVSADATTMEKVKAFLRSFILVRNKDEVTAEQELWNTQISELQKAIIFADFVKTSEILANEELVKLGGENFTNFDNLFKTYLKQQQALQAVLGAFIEGYNYDY